MTNIEDAEALKAWLHARPVEYACALAVRAALRAAPVLRYALYEDSEDRRRNVILPSFRALAAASYAGASPMRASEVRNTARTAGLNALDAVIDLANSARMAVFEANDVVPDISEYICNLESDARALGLAKRAVDAIMQSVQAASNAVEVERGIARPASVYEAALGTAVAAHGAFDGIHGDADFFNGAEDVDTPGTDVSERITEFWTAAEEDTKCLDTVQTAGWQPERIVADLTEKPLWLNRTPVWVGRQWASFKDLLPDEEGWHVWIDWYEARLAGRVSIEDLEFVQIGIPQDDWDQGPTHVNAIIAQLIQARANPLEVAISHGLEELDAVSQLTSIDLSRHKNRIRSALADDPHLVIGATKEMLEAAMKTVLYRRGHGVTDNIGFSELTTRCLSELGLSGTSPPASEGERHMKKIASSAQRMIETINELRNKAGTGHGRALGEEPEISKADAGLVASTGLILAVWLLRHDDET